MRLKHYGKPPTERNDWKTIRSLLPYLWEFKGRVFLALGFLLLAKVANVSVPLVLKGIVDALSEPQQLLILPVALFAAYGLLRLGNSLFGELRDAVFVKVTQRSIRRVALKVFETPARALAAFPPRPPDRRHVARHRTRRRRYPLPAQLHAVQYPADAARNRFRRRHPVRQSTTRGSASSPSRRWWCTSSSRCG